MSAVTTLLSLVPCLTLLAPPAQPAAQAPAESRAPQRLFETVSLPYDGSGELYVLDDGTLIIEAGGGFRHDPVTGKEFLRDSEIVAVPLDPVSTVLVVHENQWFLDKGGAAIEARSLSSEEVGVTWFMQAPEDDAGQQRQSLADFQGWLSVDFNPRRGLYRVEAADRESGGVFFTAFVLPDQGSRGRIAPIPTGGCSATCPNGDCTVHICHLPKCPKCWCDKDGAAHCVCADCSLIEAVDIPDPL